MLAVIQAVFPLAACSRSVRSEVDHLPAQVVQSRSAELVEAGFNGSVAYTAVPQGLDLSILPSGGILDVSEFHFEKGRITFMLLNPMGTNHSRYVVVERMRSGDTDRVTVMIVVYDDGWRIRRSTATDVIPPQTNAHR